MTKHGHARLVAEAVTTAVVDWNGSDHPQDRLVLFEPARLDRVMKALTSASSFLSVRDSCQAEMDRQIQARSADGAFAALVLSEKVEKASRRERWMLGPDGELRRLE